MRLRFLIIHESSIIKNIIRKYIMTDYSGAAADLSVSPENTFKLLEEKKYDAVFSGLEMTGMSGLEIQERMRMSDNNRDTPLVMMLSTDSKAQLDDLYKQGISYILPIPFSSVQFRTLIYRLFHPENPSLEMPYDTPRTRAVIYAEHLQIPADVLHIGKDSIVCEVTEPASAPPQASQIAVQFPADYGRAIVIYLTGNLLALTDHTRTSDKTSKPCLRLTWKVAWKSFELAAAAKKTLKLFLGECLFPNFQEDISRLSEENAELRTVVNALSEEKLDLVYQLSQLRKKVSELEKAGSGVSKKKDFLSSGMINEAAKPSENPFKIGIFKKIIEENVELRASLPGK